MRRRAFLALAVPALGVGAAGATGWAMLAGSGAGATEAAGATLAGCGGPDGQTAPARLSGPLTPASVAALAQQAGWRGEDVAIAVAIAQAESSLNPRATNANTNGSIDYGLFQINTVHAEILASGDPFDAGDNAAMAFAVWQQAGRSFEPWVTFWSGAYRRFLQPVSAAGAGGACVPDGSLRDPGDGPQGPDMMVPRAHNIKMLVRKRWGIENIGGYSYRVIAGTNTLSDHATGHAVDIMLGSDYAGAAKNAQGWEISRWIERNSQALGVKYIIFDDQINTGSGWRPYEHPSCPARCGNDTLAHRDHVHCSVL